MRPRRRTQRSAAGADLDTAISAGLRSPKYVQLYNSLREWIFEGRYPPGAKLPTEQELATRLRVSRNTARQAIQMLVTERLVSRQAGRGTFVQRDLASAPVSSDFNQLMRRTRRLGSKQGKPDPRELLRRDLTVILGNAESGSVGNESKEILDRLGIYAKVVRAAAFLAADSRSLSKAMRQQDADLTMNWRATGYAR